MAAIENLINAYSKKDGDSNLRDSINLLDPSGGSDTIKSDSNDAPADYTKGPGSISSFLIVVISGGEVRERNYLTELSRKQTFPRIKLIFASSEKGKGGLSPKMMQNKLNDIVETGDPIKTPKILYSSIDKIFMVSDVDHYYNELKSILQSNNDPKIIWTISNPCFEIWLYYAHFADISDEIKILEAIPQSQQSSTLKNKTNIVVDGGIDPRKAFEHIQTANINSKRNYAEDDNGIPKLYCTSMYILGEYLLEVIGEREFEKWLDEKQKRIEAYKRKAT